MELLALLQWAGSLARLGRRPHTAEVAGSNPARPTKKMPAKNCESPQQRAQSSSARARLHREFTCKQQTGSEGQLENRSSQCLMFYLLNNDPIYVGLT